MRIKFLALISFFVLSFLTGQAQNSVFDKLSKKSGIQVVQASKSLLEMMPKETGGVDLAKLADKLKYIYIYTSETAEAAKFMNQEAASFDKDKSYEKFMSIKEKNQTIVFYGQKNGEKFNDLIMIVNEKDKCIIRRFQGEFTAKDIQSVIKKDETK